MLRATKILHTLSSIGLMGGVAAILVMLLRPWPPGSEGFVAVRANIDALFHWVLVPSMLVCIFTGWVSMFLHRPYWNALWAWVKAVSGLPVIQFTLRLQGVSGRVSWPEVLSDRAELAEVLHQEASGLWVLIALGVLNVVVGVWRPFRTLQRTLPS